MENTHCYNDLRLLLEGNLKNPAQLERASHQTEGAGTVHFMKSLFSESKGFLYLDFQGRWVSSAAALLGKGKSYLYHQKKRESGTGKVCVCVLAGGPLLATINSHDTAVAN